MLEDRAPLLTREYRKTSEKNPSWCTNHTAAEATDTQKGKRALQEEEEDPITINKLPKRSQPGSLNPTRVSNPDTSPLIPSIGRDNSISCLIRCSRGDYGSISCLNRSFRSLISTGEIYRLRRLNGVTEHWVYFSCHPFEWEAFDPTRLRWTRLPMEPNECFMYADKESLAVGTDLLVFGRDLTAHVVHRYSLLTNSWTDAGSAMNEPRYLFGSASYGGLAILAGGCDSQGNILSSAELYDSEAHTWRVLKSMNKPRKMCSGVFMDGKFYVVGGIGGEGSSVLTCGEEYDLETGTWREIPKMSPVRASSGDGDVAASSEAPPLIAVVGNELYAADYADMAVRRYSKRDGIWETVGGLPERANSMMGWGLAFRACGDRLIVIGGPRNGGQGFIEINSWAPREGVAPRWELLGRKQSGTFVYNCAVMGC